MVSLFFSLYILIFMKVFMWSVTFFFALVNRWELSVNPQRQQYSIQNYKMHRTHRNCQKMFCADQKAGFSESEFASVFAGKVWYIPYWKHKKNRNKKTPIGAGLIKVFIFLPPSDLSVDWGTLIICPALLKCLLSFFSPCLPSSSFWSVYDSPCSMQQVDSKQAASTPPLMSKCFLAFQPCKAQ